MSSSSVTIRRARSSAGDFRTGTAAFSRPRAARGAERAGLVAGRAELARTAVFLVLLVCLRAGGFGLPVAAFRAAAPVFCRVAREALAAVRLAGPSVSPWQPFWRSSRSPGTPWRRSSRFSSLSPPRRDPGPRSRESLPRVSWLVPPFVWPCLILSSQGNRVRRRSELTRPSRNAARRSGRFLLRARPQP